MMFGPSVIYNKMTSQKNSLKKVQSHNLLASSGQVEQIWAAVQYPYFERKVFYRTKKKLWKIFHQKGHVAIIWSKKV